MNHPPPTGTPSQRLRDDLDALVELARLAPPDECGWGWEHHATNIQSVLFELDQEFAHAHQGERR